MSDLNNLLYGIAMRPHVSPIIQLPNGLYSFIGVDSCVFPDPTQDAGTNLAMMIDYGVYNTYADVFEENEVSQGPYYVLGEWNSASYQYDDENNEWNYEAESLK